MSKELQDMINGLLEDSGTESEEIEEGVEEEEVAEAEAEAENEAETEEAAEAEDEAETEEAAEEGTEEAETEEPAEEEEKAEEPETGEEEPEDELAALKAQNEALLEQLNNLSRPEEKEEPKVEEETKQTVGDFLEGLEVDFDKFQDDPEEFKKFMGTFAERIQTKTVESVLTSLPDVVTRHVTHSQTLKSAAEKFYEENSDLAPIKPYVAKAATAVAAEHPDWTVDQVFAETATRVRTALKLQKTAVASAGRKAGPKAKTRKPGSGGGSRQRQSGGSKLSKMEQQIQDVIDLG